MQLCDPLTLPVCTCIACSVPIWLLSLFSGASAANKDKDHAYSGTVAETDHVYGLHLLRTF